MALFGHLVNSIFRNTKQNREASNVFQRIAPCTWHRAAATTNKHVDACIDQSRACSQLDNTVFRPGQSPTRRQKKTAMRICTRRMAWRVPIHRPLGLLRYFQNVAMLLAVGPQAPREDATYIIGSSRTPRPT
jgi:hypothetical protein